MHDKLLALKGQLRALAENNAQTFMGGGAYPKLLSPSTSHINVMVFFVVCNFLHVLRWIAVIDEKKPDGEAIVRRQRFIAW